MLDTTLLYANGQQRDAAMHDLDHEGQKSAASVMTASLVVRLYQRDTRWLKSILFIFHKENSKGNPKGGRLCTSYLRVIEPAFFS